MTCEFTNDGVTYLLTTEHSQSSYGFPVLLIDGELTDITINYSKDPDE